MSYSNIFVWAPWRNATKSFHVGTQTNGFQSARNLEDNGLWNLNGSYRPLHHSQNTRKRERGQRGSGATTVLKKKTIKVKEKKIDKDYAETQASGVKPDY